jgi:hypothetical protein
MGIECRYWPFLERKTDHKKIAPSSCIYLIALATIDINEVRSGSMQAPEAALGA